MAKFKPNRTGKHCKGHGRPKKKLKAPKYTPPTPRPHVPLYPKPASDLEAIVRIGLALERIGFDVLNSYED